ncbi:MAG: STAS domain-containing protein [Bacteroidales bacterium]|nr:STAS domain-containing protein [Bacteroidales bacterium]
MATTKIVIEGNKATLVLEGRLDTPSAPQVEQDIKPLYGDGLETLLIDCSAMKYISSSGIRIIISLYKFFSKKGGEVIVKGLTPEVKEVFDMTGLLDIFKIED